MPDITDITTAFVTVLDVLIAVLSTALIAGALYGIGWVLYQLDYLDFLDPEDLTSLPAHLRPENFPEAEHHALGPS